MIVSDIIKQHLRGLVDDKCERRYNVWPKLCLILSSTIVKYTGEMRLQIVEFHKDVCFPQIRANGKDSYFVPRLSFQNNPQWAKEKKSLNFFFRHHYYSAYQMFLYPWCHKQYFTYFQICISRQSGKIFKRLAQRKPAKGNGAPQSTYPVYAAFNRMLLMHCFL